MGEPRGDGLLGDWCEARGHHDMVDLTRLEVVLGVALWLAL